MTGELAEYLLGRAVSEEQYAHRIAPADDVPAVRAEVRRLARQHSVSVRTAVIDDVLVVVRADAKIWDDPASVMRSKLAPETDL